MIAFTICSNNYLSKAKVLLDSIKSRENVNVLLFVADQKLDTIKYESLGFDKIIFPPDLEISNLQWQLENYNIIEFNTALKAAAFEYIFAKTNSETIYYFDPDIKVYKELSAFEKYWKNSSIVLTPHILSPLPLDDFFPGENLFLNHGTYNLGFLGLRKGAVAIAFLKWWGARLAKRCVIDLKDGYFTDQLWFNLVPQFFKDVEILGHHGFNAAYWNLHEREISFNNGFPRVNSDQDLFFYHFSGFDKNLKTLIPSEKPRHNFENSANLIALYDDYLKDLNKNLFLQETNTSYYNGLYPIKKKRLTYLERIIKRLNR